MTAAKAAMIALLLEPFLVPNAIWFEQHIDFLSVHASMTRGSMGSRWERIKARRTRRCVAAAVAAGAPPARPPATAPQHGITHYAYEKD